MESEKRVTWALYRTSHDFYIFSVHIFYTHPSFIKFDSHADRHVIRNVRAFSATCVSEFG